MDDHSLIAWIVLSLGLVLTPGPDTILVASHAAKGGLRAGFCATAGVVVGGLWYVALCGFGFLSLLTAFPTVFVTVKIVGALYLAWLGIKLLRSAANPMPQDAETLALGRPFWQGVLTTILNPKVALFFLAVLPQFVGIGPSGPAKAAALVAVPYLLTAPWLVTVAFLAAKAGKAAKSGSAMRWIEALLGAAFIGLAGKLVLSRS